MFIANFLKKITGLKPLKRKQNGNGAKKLKPRGNKQISALRMVSLLLIFILLTMFSATLTFVYQSVISTIGQIQSIVIYQSASVIDLIDFQRLNKVEKEWHNKLNIQLAPLVRDPFAVTELVEIAR